MKAGGDLATVDPRAPIDVLEGIESYMKENKVKDIQVIIGSLKK